MNAVGVGALQEIGNVGKVAVNKVNLTLKEGERLGIVGHNGAGKSTLLHMIAGISEPTSGQISVNGKVTSIMTLGVGLRDDLSGRENIYVDGEVQGKSRAEVDQVIDQVIEFAELGKFIDYPVRTYSTGMKARLAFAMITHIEPEILIIDEALSVGDAAFAAKATARILDICAKGKIVIFVSHGMQAVRDICNRCIYLKDGRVVMDGAPEVVTKAYIDEVRDEEEALLMVRFATHVGNRSLVSGYEIKNLLMLSGESRDHSVRIEAGQRLRIRVNADCLPGNSLATCRISIVRLDDLIVFQQEFPAAYYFLAEGANGLELDFSPLPLAPAVYRLDVELRDHSAVDATVCAASSSVFEIYSLSPPAGGKPMLYYPVSGRAVPV
ncbi:MAG: ABC transporter ATP-binding protein [Zoogloeaceae bacterium]|nr:ABC transporter ATP-binding protein [Zoogloeaceae bacterium]